MAELRFAPCLFPGLDDRRVEAERGRLEVPERHGDPDSRRLGLAVVRFPARCAEPGPPVIVLAGGPGYSGIGDARGRLDWIERIRTSADVVVLDERGVGLSDPALDAPLCWDLPLDEPLSREGFLAAAEDRCGRMAAWWRDRGVDPAAFHAEESADDIEALRRALGAERIALHGASYGSHLGLAVIRRHGDRVARAVIGLVEGMDDTVKSPALMQAHMARLAELARADPAVAERVPDLLGLATGLRDRLDARPERAALPDGRRIVLSGFDLQRWLCGALGEIEDMRRLPARLLRLAGGDLSELAADAAAERKGWLANGAWYLTDCASGLSADRRARIAREAPSTLLGDVCDLPVPHVGATMGAADLGDGFRRPVTSDVPVLFVSGELDGRTPAANAEAVLAGFRHGRHVVIGGLGHAWYDEPAETEAVLAFLRGEASPERLPPRPFAFDMPA